MAYVQRLGSKADLEVSLSPDRNTTQTYGVFYPEDGELHTGFYNYDEAQEQRARQGNLPDWPGAVVVRVTIERLDP